MFLGSQTQILYPCIRPRNENFASTTHKVDDFAIDLLARRIRGRWEGIVVLKAPHCKRASSKKRGCEIFPRAEKYTVQLMEEKLVNVAGFSINNDFKSISNHLAFLALYIFCQFFPHCTCWLNEGKFKFNREIKAPSTLATPEKWTTFSLWKRINCFLFTLHRLGNVENGTGPDCVWRGFGQGNHLIVAPSSILGILRFQKVFLPHYNAERVFWNSSGSEEHFRIAPFSRQISVEMSYVFKYHRSSVNAALGYV